MSYMHKTAAQAAADAAAEYLEAMEAEIDFNERDTYKATPAEVEAAYQEIITEMRKRAKDDR